MSDSLHPQFWWFLARASGITAWALALVAVLLGMALATRALGNRPRAPWLLDLHRFVGASSVGFVGLHLGSLVADSYVHFGVADLVVPFASSWRPAAVAWGVIACWLLVAVEVSSLFMRRIPKPTWRAIHLSSYAVVVLSTVHTFTAGTDAANPLLLLISVVALSGSVFFFVYRLLLPRRRASRSRRMSAAADRAARPMASTPSS